jgi:hypothetical protein
MTMHNPRKYTRADLAPGTFALVRARGGIGAFVARVDAFPAGARMAVGVSVDTGRRVRFSPARVLGVTADAAEARSESDVRRAARLARRDRIRRLADGVDKSGRPSAAAAAAYDAMHGARSDGYPPSDSDPATGAQYGEAV